MSGFVVLSALFLCLCNGQDRGVCEKVAVPGGEVREYVMFTLVIPGVEPFTVLKRAKECKRVIP